MEKIGRKQKIAFQGAPGAYSDLACRQLFPEAETIPCTSFDDAFEAVKQGRADLAVIPIDNTLAGRVADVHHLLPDSGLYIIGEHFLPVRHCLLAVNGSQINGLTHVHSHIHALPQCRRFIRDKKLTPIVHADTAGAAAEIARLRDKSQAAIASFLAAKTYNLEILAEDIQDADHNTTRFVVLSTEPVERDASEDGLMTSFVFEVRNIPAALYKALGGFATNGVNMTKLESYVDSQFNAARFYCEVEGHPDHLPLTLALEELAFFAKHVRIIGCFKASEIRKTLGR